MTRTLVGGFMNKPPDKAGRRFAPSRLMRSHEPGPRDDSLLRMAVREQMQRHRISVLTQAGFFAEFEIGCQPAQPGHLIPHLGCGDFGGLAEAGNLLLAPLRRAAKKWGQPLASRQARIIRSRLGESIGLLGAARYAMLEIDRRVKPAGS